MKKKYWILLYLLLSITLNVSAQSEKIKALHIYNIAKYVEWPAKQREGNFVIGVLGSSSIIDELNLISKKAKVGNRPIVVNAIASVDAIDNCHILYIATGKSSVLPAVIQKLSGKNTLIVTDKDGLARQGAGINFIIEGSKIKYEINKQNIEKNGLSVSGNLLSLGIVVK